MLPVIVWDVDDVLNDLMRSWFEGHWLPQNPDCPVSSYQDLQDNPPHQLLGIAKETYLASLDEFRLSSAFQGLRPVPEVIAWFRKFGAGFQHLALTAVPRATVGASAGWVMRNFGDWIRGFAYVPALRENDNFPVYAQTKGEYLRGKEIALFIDDSEENVRQVAKENIKTLLFPRPWNSGEDSVAEFMKKIAEAI